MSNAPEDDINRLQDQVNRLVAQQVRLQRAIASVQQEINLLKSPDFKVEASAAARAGEASVLPVGHPDAQPLDIIKKPARPVLPAPVPKVKAPSRLDVWLERINWEQFLGENLVSKIGILILVIGVGIGAKYAIDNQMVSPLSRIIMGYVSGLVLIALALKLKLKYQAFSAVLLSGGLAILYFITFMAYGLYGLLPQMAAFALMVVFTGFTVLASIRYNQMLIALLGMVGAYAVPFLLSHGSGKVEVLFTYILLINTGLLVLAFYRNWKVLLYAAIGFTWLIFAGWLAQRYYLTAPRPLVMGFGFATAYFLVFYAALLVYPLLRKVPVKADIAALIPVNGLVYFGLGYLMLDDAGDGEGWLGAFALLNAALHLAVAAIIKKQNAGDRTLTYLVVGMVFLFVSLAVPLQLDGYPVTLIWIGEAIILLWVARKQGIKLYEISAYVLVAVAFISLLEDWNYLTSDIPAFWNKRFLTSVLFSLALGGTCWIFFRHTNKLESVANNGWYGLATFVLPAMLIFTLFFGGWLEIGHYWAHKFSGVAWSYPMSSQINRLESIVKLIYVLVFGGLLALVNFYAIRNTMLSVICLGSMLLSCFYFMTGGLLSLANLRDSYLSTPQASYVSLGQVQLFRYLSMACLAATVWVLLLYVSSARALVSVAPKVYETALATLVVWLLSSELIHWLSVAGSVNTYRFGLTILWGSCALILVAFGITKRKQHLRLLAFGLFGASLLKVFFYDLQRMGTLGRTAVLVALGILMLLISFLYNKNKQLFANADAIPTKDDTA